MSDISKHVSDVETKAVIKIKKLLESEIDSRVAIEVIRDILSEARIEIGSVIGDYSSALG